MSTTSYYINLNAQANGDYEVHRDGCYWLTLVLQRRYLGSFLSCHPAVATSRALGYVTANGCYHCSRACHTG